MPQPGDFAVVNTGSRVGPLIELGEALSGGGFSQFDHAVICSRIVNNIVLIVEAEGNGAVEHPWHYEGKEHLWSTGHIATSPLAGEKALTLVGTPYSFADYFAIAAHSLHIPLPYLKRYVASSKHLICSQLVDYAELLAGVHLFNDGRWPGYVRPSDLANLILEAMR